MIPGLRTSFDMNWMRTSIGVFLVMVAVLNASLCLRGFLQGWFGVSWWHYFIFSASLCLLFGGLRIFSESRWGVPIVAISLLLTLVWLFSWAFGNRFWDRYPAGGLVLLTIALVGGLAYSFSGRSIGLAAAGSIGLLINDARGLQAMFAIRTGKSMFPYRVGDVDRTVLYFSMLLLLDILCLVCCTVLVRRQSSEKCMRTSEECSFTRS